MVATALFLGSIAFSQEAPAAGLPEYQLKAAFLYNFAKFIEWPPKAFKDARTPLTIGIYGRNPFGSVLQELIEGKRVGERSFAVKLISKPEEVREVHLLFLPAGEESALPGIRRVIEGEPGTPGLPILSVCEFPEAERQGCTIAFIVEESRIRFAINRSLASKFELNISSKLLQLAIRIEGR